MSDPATDIIVPTLWRAHQLGPFLDALHKHTTMPFNVTFVVNADDEDTIDTINNLDGDRASDGWSMVVPAGSTMIEKVNHAFGFTHAPFLIGLSDDVRVLPGWLEAAFDHMVEGVNLVCLNDQVPGHVHDGELTGHVLGRRSYFVEQGGVMDETNVVMHGGYVHYFSDMELWQVGKARGCYVSAFDALVDHPHPNAGTAPRDRTHDLSIGFMAQDRRLYESRRWQWSQLEVMTP